MPHDNAFAITTAHAQQCADESPFKSSVYGPVLHEQEEIKYAQETSLLSKNHIHMQEAGTYKKAENILTN